MFSHAFFFNFFHFFFFFKVKVAESELFESRKQIADAETRLKQQQSQYEAVRSDR